MEFPSTHWSVLAEATLHGDATAAHALADFCGRYRQPIVQFIRWRGISESDAEDVAHDFLVHLIEKSTLRRADAARGRFRSFLLGALVRFLGHVRDRQATLKRGGKQRTLELDAIEDDAAVATQPAEVEAFDREWAIRLLTFALDRMEAEYLRNGREKEFAVLRAYVPGAVQPPPYDESAAALGQSLGAFKTEVHRMRKRLRTLVREEVAATVTSPEEIEAEIAYFGRALGAPKVVV